MCMIDDAETWVFSSTKHPRAHIKHVCGECGRTIGQGETYLKVIGFYDGRFDTYKSCAHCEVAAGWLVNICGGFLTQGVREDLGEHWDEWELRHYWLGRYMLSIDRKWTTKTGQLMPIPDLHLPAKFLTAAS